jgi:hypothetical protein
MRRHTYLVRVAVLSLLVGPAADLTRAQESDQLKRVREKVAQRFVYRIEAGDNQGSAVLLDVAGADCYLATCYHVMLGAKALTLIDANNQTAFDGSATKYYAVPHHDIVILRISRGDAKGLLKGADSGSLAYKEAKTLFPRTPDVSQPVPLGFIAGFPFYNNAYLDVDVARVDPEHSTEMAYKVLNRLDKDPAIRGDNDRTRGLQFGYVGLRPTVPGMSGGLVLTDRLEFAGLIFGRIPDTVGLMIPRRFVEDALRQAKGKSLPDIARAEFTRESWPFSEKVRAHLRSGELASVIEWDEFAHWSNYFQDPAPFREAFQEVVLNSELLAGGPGGSPAPLSLRVGERSFDDREPGKHKVSLWVNGRAGPKMVFDKGQSIDLSPHLVAGENLLIVSKSNELPDPRHEFNVSKLLSSSRLEIDLLAGGRTVCHIVRSLPALARNYSVYVTLQTPFKPEPHHARLAVRADWIQDVLGGPVHTWKPKDVTDPHSGSYLKGFVEFRPQDDQFLGSLRREWERAGRDTWVPKGSVGLRPRTLQTLDVALLAEVHLEDLYANYLGTRIRARPSSPLRLLLRGRLQLVRSPDPDEGFFLCVRAVSAYTDAKLDVPLLRLGDVQVQADLAGVMQEAFLNWVNSEFLHPDRPLPLLPRAPRGATVAFRPSQAFLRDGWIVVTFQLYNPTGKRLHERAQEDVDLTGLARDATTLVDFEGRNVAPGALPLGALPGKYNSDPIISEMARTSAPLPFFHMSLKRSPAPPAPAGPYALDEDLDKLTEHFRDLIVGQVGRGSVTVDARLGPAVLAALLAGRFNRGAVAPAGAEFRGEVGLTRSGDVTKLTGKKVGCALSKLGIDKVRLDNVDVDIADLNLTAKGPELVEGSVTLKLNGADLTLPGDDVPAFKNLRCEKISVTWKGEAGMAIEYEEARFDGGKIHGGKIRLDKNGRVIPNNN